MANETPEMIVRYVDDEMTETERLEMEAAIAADPSLAESAALYREMKESLALRMAGDAGRNELKKTLGAMRGQYFEGAHLASTGGLHGEERTEVRGVQTKTATQEDRRGKGRVISMRRWITGIAAAAAVLVAVVLLWPSEPNWLEKYGGTQMVNGVERGEGNDSVMVEAAEHFNRADYSGSLSLLQRVIDADSSNQEALFYRGVARLHTGSTDSARKDLELVFNGASVYKYEAAYYMALSYAGSKHRGNANIWLDKIPSDAPVAEKVKALRKRLQ